MAAAQRAGRRREALGRRPPSSAPATRSPTSAGGTPWAPTSTARSPRGRSTTPTAARSRTATPARRSCTTRSPAELGTFPLFTYWGPGAAIAVVASGSWRPPGRSCRPDPDLTLVYVPHLDYDLQRFGPVQRRRPRQAARDARRAPWPAARRRASATASPWWRCSRVRHHRRSPGPVDVNRLLRREGLLQVHTQDRHGVPRPVDLPGLRGRRPPGRPRLRRATPADVAARGQALRRACPGSAEVLDARGPEAATASTTRAPASWCWWPSRTPGSPTTTGSTTTARPTSRRLVEIHRKPGYDPAELFLDPAATAGCKARAALRRWLRKKLGLRYAMSVVALDAVAGGARLPRPAAGRPDGRPGAALLRSGRRAGPDRRDRRTRPARSSWR